MRKAFENAFGKNILDGCMKFLEKSKAIIVLHNLEDLWGETKPQNIPATTTEHAQLAAAIEVQYGALAPARDEILTIIDGWRASSSHGLAD